jgi:hypothetical protein
LPFTSGIAEMPSTSTNSVLYDAGYNDSFNRRPPMNEDTDYLQGYADGTLLLKRNDDVILGRPIKDVLPRLH